MVDDWAGIAGLAKKSGASRIDIAGHRIKIRWEVALDEVGDAVVVDLIWDYSTSTVFKDTETHFRVETNEGKGFTSRIPSVAAAYGQRLVDISVIIPKISELLNLGQKGE